MQFVEFYFPGLDCGGRKESEVTSRNVEALKSIPTYAHSCRFFSKGVDDNKINFSPRFWFGKEYSKEEFKLKFPQLKNETDLSSASRVVRTRTGGFYPLSETDIVISV